MLVATGNSLAALQSRVDEEPKVFPLFLQFIAAKQLTGLAFLCPSGTLDPAATGLLVLCTGKATRLVDEFQAQEKARAGLVKV